MPHSHRRLAMSAVAVTALLLGHAMVSWAQSPPAAGAGAGAPIPQARVPLGSGSVEERLERLERMLSQQSLSDLVLQLQRLQQEVQALRGQVELQQYRLQQTFGSRFAVPGTDDAQLGTEEVRAENGLEARGELSGPPTPSGEGAEPDNASDAMPGTGEEDQEGPVEPPPQPGIGSLGRGGDGAGGTLALPSPETTAGGEREAYRTAFDLLKERKYPEAREAFSSMLARYPRGQFADNGHYWLGEIGYVTKDYAAALSHFNRLVADWPLSPKLPSAMLKLGYVYYEQQDLEQARRMLEEIVKRFPNTTEGRLAQGRLEQMTRDGG